MTATLGPPKGDPSSNDIVPSCAIAIDVSSSDYTCSTDFVSGYCRELYIGVSGDVKATMVGGAACVYPAVPQGTFLSGLFLSVQHAGTTASGIVARW